MNLDICCSKSYHIVLPIQESSFALLFKPYNQLTKYYHPPPKKNQYLEWILMILWLRGSEMDINTILCLPIHG